MASHILDTTMASIIIDNSNLQTPRQPETPPADEISSAAWGLPGLGVIVRSMPLPGPLAGVDREGQREGGRDKEVEIHGS